MPAPLKKSRPNLQRNIVKQAERMAQLGLRSDIELALHLPFRYEDETRVMSIRDALHTSPALAYEDLQRHDPRYTQSVHVEAVVLHSEVHLKPRRQLVVNINDGTGALILRFVNFYASQVRQLASGTRLRARGEVKSGFFGAEIIHPNYKVIIEGAPLANTLTPVYPSAIGLSQAFLRKAISDALTRLNWQDSLPEAILQRRGLWGFEAALRYLHSPPPESDWEALQSRNHPAWQRVKFDELLAQQLSLKRAQKTRRKYAAPPLPKVNAEGAEGAISNALLQVLPFALTGAQQRVLKEIQADLACEFPMQRLLQGDVGSGKTVVAALAAAQAIDSGYQVALMAPTEILADQHFRKIGAWLEPLGVQVAWLTGGMKKKEKLATQALVASGEAQLVIGTHALIQDAVAFARLGLVLVDEQHRFGVGQRLSLRNKGSGAAQVVPHQLMMTATPIPRTLAMTYYADLEVSVIDELPPGRSPIVTRVIDQDRRDEVISRVGAAAQEGRQIYWVCPLIEESEALQLQAASETHAMLCAALPNLQVGLIHGRLKGPEKQAVMNAFISGEIDVLVATTVIEVGVDVPNASLMVIEHAERFGLSQLHQLRGRVGRGAAASACLLLFQSPLGYTAKQRLTTMRASTDGFEIARRDLEIRGPGEFLGARQSGQAMLRFADLEQDLLLVEAAQQEATYLLRHDTATVEAHLARWLGVREEFLKV